MHKIIFIFIIIFFYHHKLWSQNFLDLEIDSAKIIVHNGYSKNLDYTISPKKKFFKKKKNKKINTEKEINIKKKEQIKNRLNELEIDERGILKSGTTWEIEKKYFPHQLSELDSILQCTKRDTTNQELTFLCFSPKHKILLYKNNQVIAQIDICFTCLQTRSNLEQPMHCIDYEFLKSFFIKEKIPVFKNENHFLEYHKKIKIIKNK